MSDKSNLEYVMEALKGQIDEFQANKKRLEVRIKELTGQVEEAELVAAKRIAAAAEKAETEIAALKQESAPFKDLVQQCEQAKRTLATVKQALLDETASLKSERHAQLVALDLQIKRATDRIGKLNAEEEAFRKRIALV
jgi:chromosome segregation ATPase